MADRLVTIATFGSPIEAALAKNRLELAGIPARLAEEETVGLFGSVIGPALGGVKLLVSEEQVLRAEDVLADLGAGEERAADQDDESPGDATDLANEPELSEDTDAITVEPVTAGPREEPVTAITPARPEPDESTFHRLLRPPQEQLAKRALIAAVVGIVIFDLVFYLYWRGPWRLTGQAVLVAIVLPLLVHVYSVILLLRLGKSNEELSGAAYRYVWMAVALDLVYLSAGTIVIIWWLV